ncbi:MAG TPA: hypothetical protein EYP57_00830 [Thermodesulfobacteriaceae bacterium]|nr:hypothetical protein [Thermodesulfobacteriaceae bacterium]
MLDFIRTKAHSWMIKFILGAIVIVFVFWGIGSFRSERLDVIAKVNGEKILVESYRQAYGQAVERYRQMFGGKIPEQLLEQMNIKKQVLNALIDDVLIRQHAEEIGIRVIDQEVQRFVMNIPAFKENGVFNRTRYERALTGARLTPPGFEESVRQQILREKLQTIMVAGLAVTDEEIRAHYAFENEEVNFSYLVIDAPGCREEVNATGEKLTAWYDSHKERYLTEPQIRLRYLLFSPDDYESSVNATDADVQAYYQSHPDEFKSDEQRRARHILLKLPQDANETKAAEVRNRADEVYKRLEQGEDFERLAREISEDKGSAPKGGDLGFFGRGDMVRPFEKTVFELKVGETSRPVRTQFGWHVIRLEDIREAAVKPLAEVREAIVKTVKARKAEKAARQKADEAYDEIIQLGSLEAFEESSGLKLQETGLFTRKKPPALLGTGREIIDTLFSLEAGELTSLLHIPQGFLVAEVSEEKEPYVPEFDQVRDKVRNEYIKAQAFEICRSKAREILEDVREESLDVVARRNGLQVRETGFFKRTDRNAGGKLPPEAARAAMSLHEGKIYPDDVVESGISFYILAFKAKNDADPEGMSKQSEAIADRLLAWKQRTVFADWLGHQREKATIEIKMRL